MESATYTVRQRHLREALAREVWLGFKAGRLAVNGQRPQCPHALDSNHAAVWLAAVEVSLHPDFFKPTVPPALVNPPAESGGFAPDPSPAASVEEKLEAALDEIVALTSRVIDLEYAVKIMQPATEPAAKKPKARKAKAK